MTQKYYSNIIQPSENISHRYPGIDEKFNMSTSRSIKNFLCYFGRLEVHKHAVYLSTAVIHLTNYKFIF